MRRGDSREHNESSFFFLSHPNESSWPLLIIMQYFEDDQMLIALNDGILSQDPLCQQAFSKGLHILTSRMLENLIQRLKHVDGRRLIIKSIFSCATDFRAPKSIPTVEPNTPRLDAAWALEPQNLFQMMNQTLSD